MKPTLYGRRGREEEKYAIFFKSCGKDRSYFYDYFQKNSNNMKQIWSGIKSVISIRKSSNVNVISKQKDKNANITSDPAVIANIFNKYFVNVAQDITKNLPISNKSHLNFMADRNGNSFL